MATPLITDDRTRSPASTLPRARRFGPLGRLGRFTATHARQVGVAWFVLIAVLALFAPKVETALAGAGWQANGSQSVKVRALAQSEFGGQSSTALQVVVHAAQPVSSAG